ncbi:transmembrane protein [Halalkalibacter wakoensis JCM 9140]|uniref:Transmembrane protein n=1 Tax=Halalkalibacter wakoensis JCM 9140 TaxID=1236970 RepID=W4Q112_9BACI|nr:transmembrane protein [Halalkalibacter wakoensis JCM 9140]
MGKHILSLFGQRWVIVLLLLINVPGTIAGYLWYQSQLELTPSHFLLFVPDSPTASFVFCVCLNCFFIWA